MDIKKPGNLIFIVGLTKNELGGSHYYKINKQLGANVPKVDLAMAPKIAQCIHQAICKGLVQSCHDCSEGGLAVALAEMAFAGDYGIDAGLKGLPVSNDCTRADTMLFSESNSRYIVEIKPEHFNDFAKLMLNLPFGKIGEVIADRKLNIASVDGQKIISADLDILKASWQSRFKW
jgi:phosphoribosylformylglycinamidine synthase